VCANQETILIGAIFFRISGNKKAYTQLKQLVLFHVRKHSAALRASRDAWRGLPRHREVQHLAANFYVEWPLQVAEETRSTSSNR